MLSLSDLLLLQWHGNLILLSYPDGTVHHVERWPNFHPRSQKNTSWYPVSRRLHQSESCELLEIIPSFIFYWVFECVQKSVHLKWNKTKCHKKGFYLSLCVSLKSLSLSLHEQTSNAASNQTQDKQFIKNGGTPSFTESHRSTCTTMQKK